MEILENIATLKKSIEETDKLVEELISSLQAQKLKVENKENKILHLKNEVRNNLDKIDKIIEDYNANS
tara:strand:+ start:85 stop:288 length:204 start_codon:yes stop_codon:yes gene_type:complete